jgi:hypothetical protein
MPLSIATAGRSRIDAAIKALIAAPMRAIGLVAATILVAIVSPLWGFIHPMAGWHKCRARLAADGLSSLGEVLVPDQAILDYKDGIWKGLYRVHTSSIGFAVLQLPVMILLLVPVIIAQILFDPVGDSFVRGNRDLAQLFTDGVPGIVALSSFTIIFGQTMLATRVLGQVPPSHPLGTSYVATSAAWRGALKDPAPLISIGILTSVVGLIGGLFGFINNLIAEELELVGGGAPQLWINILLVIVAGAVLLEALGKWSEECNFGKVEIPAKPYSFMQAFWGRIVWFLKTIWDLICRVCGWAVGLIGSFCAWAVALLSQFFTIRYHRLDKNNKGGE